ERLLGRDRDAFDLEVERPWIDPAGTLAEENTDLAGQEPLELGVLDCCQPSDRVDAGRTHAALGLWPDAWELAHVEGGEERRFTSGRHDREAPGFPAIARHLGHDLARRDSERARQARRAAHGRLDCFRHASRLEEIRGDLTHVQVALVDARP